MRHKRGVVLITVLFFILLIGILSRAILFAGPLMAKVGAQLTDELYAQRAAEAGAAYARAQMKDKNDWKGNKDTTTLNLADLKVVEDKGNVIGWLRSASGQVALFRIRFNYQDGLGGPDNLDDPAPAHRIDSVYVSINNFVGGAPATIPRANPTSPWTVPSPLSGPQISDKRAVVEIEGLAGPAVQSLTGPGPLGSGQVTRRTLRVCYAAAGAPGAPDAVISAGSGIAAELTNAARVTVAGSGTARLRTKKSITVGKGDGTVNILDMTGEAGRDTTAALTGLNATLTGSVVAKTESVGDGQDFYNLKWDDVAKASTVETEAVQLPGGIYITGGDGKVRYYDKDPSQFKTMDQSVGCVTITSPNFAEVRSGPNLAAKPLGILLDSSTFAINVTEDLNIKSSTSGINDVMFTVPSGRKISANDTAATYLSSTVPMSFYAPGVLQVNDCKLSCAGNLTVMTNLQAKNGTLTAGGNATVCAPSVVIDTSSSTTFTQRLSVYVKNDLTLSTWMENPALPPYVPAISEYGPLTVRGLVYTWGDANIIAGTAGANAGPGVYKASNYGNVTITGALVSYGADPASSSPGSAGNGKVSIFGEQADITYDATLLSAGSVMTPGAPLDSIKRVSYGFERQ